MRDVYIVGVACTPFGNHVEKSFRALAQDVVGLLELEYGENGGAVATEIDTLWFGNCFMHAWGQANVRGQMTFLDLVEEERLPSRLPVTNVEAACATGSVALHGAVNDIRSGQAELSASIGIEKLLLPRNGSDHNIFDLFLGCADNLSDDRLVDLYRSSARTVGRELVIGHDRSLFMDTYAIQAMLHMKRFARPSNRLRPDRSRIITMEPRIRWLNTNSRQRSMMCSAIARSRTH